MSCSNSPYLEKYKLEGAQRRYKFFTRKVQVGKEAERRYKFFTRKVQAGKGASGATGTSLEKYKLGRGQAALPRPLMSGSERAPADSQLKLLKT